jgi:hypothetical protein
VVPALQQKAAGFDAGRIHLVATNDELGRLLERVALQDRAAFEIG